MKYRILGVVGTVAFVAGLVLSTTTTAGAATGNQGGSGGQAPSANLNIVHGIPGLDVDIYVVKNLDISKVKEFSNVTFATAVDLNTALPGFITPGLYTIDIVAHGGNPFKPALITSTYLGAGQSETAVAYISADASGKSGSPTLSVFHNKISATKGQARVTIAHAAVAPTVGVCADKTIPLVPSFSNGQQASAVVSPAAYTVTVTAPNNCSDVLAGPIGPVTLAANTTTLVYAIGTFPKTFTVASLVVPNNAVAVNDGW
jgi:hypothetical protein